MPSTGLYLLTNSLYGGRGYYLDGRLSMGK